MKLYYLPGSCALGPHIALELSGLAYEAVRVERGTQTDPPYLAVNPLGQAPALVTLAHGTITEAPAVLTYIADVAAGQRLLPEAGTPERCQVLRWMAYLSSSVHPAFGRLWRAERFCDDADCQDSVRRSAAAQLTKDFGYIERHLSGRRWVAGTQLTVADLHLFVFGRLGLRLAASTRDFPNLHRHMMDIYDFSVTKKVMAEQKIALEGPASGGPG